MFGADWFTKVPESDWQPPSEFPDLSAADKIAVDLETNDPNLKDHGPGWATGKGNIAGIAVAVEDWKGYFPILHENGTNMDRDMVLRWMRDVMSDDKQDKVFANATYDVGWLKREGVEVKGRWLDVQVAAPLLDENARSYSLNALGEHYLKETKSESLLYDAAEVFGFDRRQAKGKIHVLPPQYVGIYGEQDADLTLRLWDHLWQLIQSKNLEEIFDLETRLTPALFQMRWDGVRFDEAKANLLRTNWTNSYESILWELKEKAGKEVDIWAAASIHEAAVSAGIKDFQWTATGKPSFTSAILEESNDPFLKKIKQARKISKGLQFITSLIECSAQGNGRIHAQIHQLRGDDYGTVSGRLSYSNPNLQQIPTRDPEIGAPLRSLFLPEENERWISADYSSQEPRVLMHYVVKRDFAPDHPLVREYTTNPDADFHALVSEQLNISRFQAKTINLGIMYGMGKAKLAAQLGVNQSDAELILNKYHTQFPFVRQLKKLCESIAKKTGEIGTLAGRRCRFNRFSPRGQYGVAALPMEEALKKWPRLELERAYTYRALNRLIQGSASDQCKIALTKLHEQGIVPKITIHDEVCASGDEDTMRTIIDCMENAVETKVPFKVEASMGDTWGGIAK